MTLGPTDTSSILKQKNGLFFVKPMSERLSFFGKGLSDALEILGRIDACG